MNKIHFLLRLFSKILQDSFGTLQPFPRLKPNFYNEFYDYSMAIVDHAWSPDSIQYHLINLSCLFSVLSYVALFLGSSSLKSDANIVWQVTLFDGVGLYLPSPLIKLEVALAFSHYFFLANIVYTKLVVKTWLCNVFKRILIAHDERFLFGTPNRVKAWTVLVYSLFQPFFAIQGTF